MQGVQGMKGRGNHIVSFRIKIPTRLTTKQRDIFSELAKVQQGDVNPPSGGGVDENVDQNIFDRMKKAFK